MEITKRVVCVLILLLAACCLLLAAVPVFASNITIYDGNGIGSVGNPSEDGETEPDMVLSQNWDLEGFFFENNELSIIGGYNFKDGFEGMDSGDIFISNDGAPQYGDIHRNSDDDPSNNGDGIDLQGDSKTYDYEYVLDLHFSDSSYSVWRINDETVLQTAFYQQNEGSSPWRYVRGGEETNYGGSFNFISGLTDTGFIGISHYALTGFDLSFLGHGTEFYSHFTMECGNDNLMGKGTVVPEPATMVLLGSGLVGLALYRRRMKK